MAHILLVGSGFSGITKHLRAYGYDYTILKDGSATRFPNKQIPHRVLCDFSSKQKILSTVDALDYRIDGVLTAYEQYVLATSWISEHLGLPGMAEQASKNCTDKWAMRQALQISDVRLNPDFAIINSAQDLSDFAARHSFPIMLKPANLVKSLLITKNDSIEELLANYRQTIEVIDKVYAKYCPTRQPLLIAEEFLEGKMYTVAGFADADGNIYTSDKIVDLKLARDIGHRDNFLYSRVMPTALDAKLQRDIIDCAKAGMVALGMRASAAHVEIILTSKGPRIVEIGARNGGYRERMYQLACGIDLTAASIDVALGKEPNIKSTKNESVAVIELFPKDNGKYSHITSSDEVNSLKSCTYFNIKALRGDYVGRAADGHKRCAIVILHNADKQQFTDDLRFVENNVKVVIE